MPTAHSVIDLSKGIFPPLRKSVYHLLYLRPVYAQHTLAEEQALHRLASGKKSVLEIGVAEGGSAAAIRETMDPGGTLYLVDPYPPGRFGVNFTKWVAQRHLRYSDGPKINWLTDFSYNVAKTWHGPIDFLFIDGDHAFEGGDARLA